MSNSEPIIACSTATEGNAAIAVIRISGFKSLNDLSAFFSLNLNDIENNKVYQNNIIDQQGVKLDQILLCFFAAPNSYNGENILELYVHGNQLNVTRIIDLFVNSETCRAANPGEFTYRALRNKKLSLTQVEGLDLFLNASAPLMLQAGLETLQGELHAHFNQLHKLFLTFRSSFEVLFDFDQDVGEQNAKHTVQKAYDALLQHTEQLYQRTVGALSSYATPKIVLSGPPNAGKSTLFNHILGVDRSIVSKISGTTRDYVSEPIYIGKTPFMLVDTAGIRSTSEELEAEGITRSREQVAGAFFNILVVDLQSDYLNDDEIVNNSDFDLFVFTHLDRVFSEDLDSYLWPHSVESLCTSLVLPRVEYTGPIGPVKINLGPIGPNSKTGSIGPAVNQSGPIEPEEIVGGPIGPKIAPLEQLVQFINQRVERKYQTLMESHPILLPRHRRSIALIYDQLKSIGQLLDSGERDISIISIDIELLASQLSEFIGIIPPEDLLTDIFDNFCIGK
ncbi:MAG: GTP-binding protein [Bdellovibrionales bacterium]|jgi:tRNA modification GTPase|nr:GTP-binding protein [Bdellovibrionales bacterium]MBT3525509.1 GTP-binding protein [Bdellovibrionales bacterium]MBT7670422.1 GTP-binding protein [Bdellovibrionales bacterium]MBT7765643.1 GTP-binding protein [Bdellovibrionales bacterium]